MSTSKVAIIKKNLGGMSRGFVPLDVPFSI
jgi:hypothetical protein